MPKAQMSDSRVGLPPWMIWVRLVSYLRSEIVRRALERALAAGDALLEYLAHRETEYFYSALHCHEEVRGLDVADHEAFGVEVVDELGEVEGQRDALELVVHLALHDLGKPGLQRP